MAGLQHVSSFVSLSYYQSCPSSDLNSILKAIVLTGISCAVLATTLGLDAHGDPRMRCMIQTALRLLAISFSLSFGALCSCYGIFAYAAFTTGPKLHTLRRLAMVISQGTILLGVVTFCGGFGLLIYVCDATR